MITNKKLSTYYCKEKVDGSTYWSLVGSLIYLTNTWPDIVYVVSIVSWFMGEPSKAHFTAPKRILSYIKGTIMVLYKRQRRMQAFSVIQIVTGVDAYMNERV